MNTANTSTPFPGLVITTVEYLHTPEFEEKPVRYLLPNALYGHGEDRVKTCEDALEVIFRQCNHVDGTEWISQPEFRKDYSEFPNIRSFSVGDCVTFRGIGGFRKYYVCEGCGFAEISQDDNAWLVKHVTFRDFWHTFARTVEESNK
jgi:hypothetical protein